VLPQDEAAVAELWDSLILESHSLDWVNSPPKTPTTILLAASWMPLTDWLVALILSALQELQRMQRLQRLQRLQGLQKSRWWKHPLGTLQHCLQLCPQRLVCPVATEQILS